MAFFDSSKKSSLTKTRNYHEPLIVQPTQEHKQTFIILHGRGSTAQKFAEPFLNHPISQPKDSKSLSEESSTFQSSFPNAKFVFPTAALRRAVIYRRSLTHQWFDNWSLDRPEYRQELQTEGLRESSTFIHGLLQSEIGLVGAQNVILVGLSQGCAASLFSFLIWDGEPIAAMIGMCGWLPFRKMTEENLQDTDEEDIFAHSDDEDDLFDSEEHGQKSTPTKLRQAVDFLKEEVEVQSTHSMGLEIPLLRVPVFLGHGTEDMKVPFELGEKAAEFLKNLEVDVRWNEYEGLEHWYSGDMLRDMIEFIHTLDGWRIESNRS